MLRKKFINLVEEITILTSIFIKLSFIGCPLNWVSRQFACYKLSSNTLEWIAAKYVCEALGSNLAILDSPAEQQEVGWGVRTWIGLHRDSSNNSRWQWIDGSLAVYLNFASNQPDNWNGTEDCVEMYPSRKWNDSNCNIPLHYSCEVFSGRSRYFRTTRNEMVSYSNRRISNVFWQFFLKKSHNGVDLNNNSS